MREICLLGIDLDLADAAVVGDGDARPNTRGEGRRRSVADGTS
jgi:hypothetical protein